MFEYNLGVRDHYEYKDAMFANSLFKDYLMENGLHTWKGETTRDIICLEFNYGSRSYRDEINHLHKTARRALREYQRAVCLNDQYLINRAMEKRQKVNDLLQFARHNRKSYQKLSTDELRRKLYNEGVDVTYTTTRRNGDIIGSQTIHYKMLFRSTGKAKKGSCMFICDRLYKKASEYLYMGIKLPEKNPMIVEISAYVPLIASGIIDRIRVNPRNILILKDVERTFKTDVVSIETNEARECHATKISDYELKNVLFDGQALIDTSIFPKWANGYVLLREHFCKMAAFHTNLQEFFKDYFGESYETATVKDMFGEEHHVKDIKIVTTDNAMKWIKFDVSYDYWCDRVKENNCMFGVVKTAHESKLGEVQRMSYQMVNSLDESIMDGVVAASVGYINRLKTDDEFFLQYLEENSHFSNDYDVLVALCRQNPDFKRSSYFRERKKAILSAYMQKIKSGEIINNAENLTVVGSPYAMLLYAATGDPDSVDNDDTFYQEEGVVQCYTERFNSGEYLAFFRSPFNSKNNLTYLHNVYHSHLAKYFNLGRQCIAINMIGTDVQDRNNGMDMDSDFGYTTNHQDIVAHAKYCYHNYPTIVNNIPKDKNVYSNTMDDYALIDNSLAKSQLEIGESSNLAQLCQTYACTFGDQKYMDYVCILSVLAQVAIDSAKRKFDVDITQEIRRIKEDINITENKYPVFWLSIRRDFKKSNINQNLHCPMNYLSSMEMTRFRDSTPTIPVSEFFVKQPPEKHQRRQCKKVEQLISKYSLGLLNSQKNTERDFDDTLLLRSDFDALISDIKSIYVSANYEALFSWLIDRALMITPRVRANVRIMKTTIRKNRPILLKTLYTVNQKAFLNCFKSADF